MAKRYTVRIKQQVTGAWRSVEWHDRYSNARQFAYALASRGYVAAVFDRSWKLIEVKITEVKVSETEG